MTIENAIKRSCINLHMKGKNKKEIIEEVADMSDRADILASRNLFIRAVYKREGEGPTGVENQVTIPHDKSDAMLKTAIAVGRMDQGVEWETLGEGDTRTFAMFAVNSGGKSELVSLLSRIAVALCDDDVTETLLTTESEEEIFTLFNRKGETQVKIVGITVCTTGIAHIYVAREKLIKGVRARDHEYRVETQGTIGAEYKLAEQEIAETNVVILIVDVKISSEERFKGEPVIRVGMVTVIRNTIGFVEKVEKAMEDKG